MSEFIDPNRLCIRMQPCAGADWRWEVAYPQGITYERGEADTPEHAVELAALALRLLTSPERAR